MLKRLMLVVCEDSLYLSDSLLFLDDVSSSHRVILLVALKNRAD